MKKFTLALFLFFCFITVYSQTQKPTKGPIIENYGTSYKIENADLQLAKDKEYKVIFDVYTDNSKNGKVNPLINTVARYINMHAAQGVELKNMKIAVILHGRATKSVLNDNVYLEKYKTENPNSELIAELKKANAEIFVCGQSLLFNGFHIKDVSNNVKVSLSALTALVEFQDNGYQIINFN